MVLVPLPTLVEAKGSALRVGTRNERFRGLHDAPVQREADELEADRAQDLLQLVHGLDLLTVLTAALKL